MNKRHWFYIGIFCGAVFGFMAGAMAETVQLPITATIIQCGTRYEALGQCKAGVDACCAFAPLDELEPAAGPKYPDIDAHGVAVEVEDTDEGFTVNFE
jgi:hypothetical protein